MHIQTPINIYKRLRRTEKCKRTIQIIKQVKNYDNSDVYTADILRIFENSAPFPLIGDLDSLSAYFPGGTRYLARYPDIVINKFDILHGKQILKKYNISHLLMNYEDKIADLVYDILNVDDLIFKDYSCLNKYPWARPHTIQCIRTTPPFFKYGHRFIERVFKCKDIETCSKTMKTYPNSLTNVSALVFTLGDCREVAWLTALLCNSGNINKLIKYRVMYTTLYVVDDEQRCLRELFDHVFVVKITDESITIIDPFAKNIYTSGIILHNARVRIVNNNEFRDYEFKHNSLILECGKIYGHGVHKHRLLAIPKIYDGHINFIDTTIFNPYPKNKVLLWNKAVPYTYERIWKKHKDWFI